MTFYPVLLIVGTVVAHKPIPQSHFISRSHPADYAHIAAMGEAYHSAWTRCAEKTTTWLHDDLQVSAKDPSFDNGYYVEYDIENRVPRTYNILKELLGEYFPAPTFSGTDENFRIHAGQGYLSTVTAQVQSVALIPGPPNDDELPDPFINNAAQDWITQNFHPDKKPITVYGGVDPRALKTSSKGYKLLYELFYNIQQTSYFCDFTLESAMFSFEKFHRHTQVELIQEERKYQNSMWSYMLKKQVAPVRWSLKMWTRFNIAESSIRKIMRRFDTLTVGMNEQLARLPTAQLAKDLGWESFESKHAAELAKIQTWNKDFTGWVGSCYPMPDDRTIYTSDKICQKGITQQQLKSGLNGADDMWYKFARPLLDAYAKTEGYDVELHQEVHDKLKDIIWNTGKPHSFRCEFKWILTRVRYFEIIPTWEIERVRDDTHRYWENIVKFRHELIHTYKVPETGIYSHHHFIEMKDRKDRITDLLTRWAAADDSVYDADGELHRNYLRQSTADRSRDANEIYYWYFNMAYQQFSWKAGAPKDFDSKNYNYSDKTAKFVRSHATSHSRLEWRKYVWRDMVRFNFHFQRRI